MPVEVKERVGLSTGKGWGWDEGLPVVAGSSLHTGSAPQHLERWRRGSPPPAQASPHRAALWVGQGHTAPAGAAGSAPTRCTAQAVGKAVDGSSNPMDTVPAPRDGRVAVMAQTAQARRGPGCRGGTRILPPCPAPPVTTGPPTTPAHMDPVLPPGHRTLFRPPRAATGVASAPPALPRWQDPSSPVGSPPPSPGGFVL